MNKEDKVKAVQEFLNWLEETTCYEVGEQVYSDYGDGDSYFYRANNDKLVIGFEDWLVYWKETSND